MTKNVTFPILADKVSQVRPQSHVCNCRLMISPFLDREALEKNETLAIKNLIANGPEKASKSRQPEVFLSKYQHPTIEESLQGIETLEMPVKGIAAALKLSAALLNSSISCSAKRCVHRSGLSL